MFSVFHVTGSEHLTFARAENLCREFDGQLVSVSDLYDARDLGYDLCRYSIQYNTNLHVFGY